MLAKSSTVLGTRWAPRTWIPNYVLILAVGAIAYLALSQLRGDQGLVAALAVVWAISLTGLNIVQGLGGYPSIAQAAFFGLGAYVSSILFNAHWPFVAAALVGIAATALVGIVVAAVFGRTRGQYFAIGTLFFGAVVNLVFTNQVDLTGGPNGLSVGLGMPLGALQITMVVSLVAGLVVFDVLSRSGFGDRLRSIRTDEDLAEHLGVPTARTKAIGFVLSAVFGAWGGVLIAQYNGVAAPSQFTFMQGFLMFVAIGIGGYGRLLTPVIGAIVVVGLTQLLKIQPGISEIALGIVFIVVTLAVPGGLVGGVESLMRRLRPRSREES